MKSLMAIVESDPRIDLDDSPEASSSSRSCSTGPAPAGLETVQAPDR